MASYARDIYFAVRVEDRATRPLRRIAADFASLGKQGLAMRQRDLQAAQRSYASSRIAQQTTRQRYRDLVTQGKQIAQSKAIAENERSIAQATLQRKGVLAQLPALYAAQAAQAGRLATLNKGLEGQVILPLSTREMQKAREESIGTTKRLREQELAYASSLRLPASEMKNQFTALQGYEAQLSALSAAESKNALATQTATRGRVVATGQALQARQNLIDASTALNRFPLDRLRGISTYLRHAGSLLATFGVAAVAAFSFAGKAAADFSTQATIAATQSTLAGQNTVAQVQKNSEVIQREILKMMQAGRVTAGPGEQTRAAYEIFSGITLKGSQLNQLKQGIQLLKEFNNVTVANQGLVSLEEATNAGIVLINRFGVSVADVPKQLNVMQAAVRFGKLTMSEFVGTLGQAAPAAQAAGYNFTQMSASIAFLSRQFPNLRLGATGYARLIELFSRKDVVDALKQHGVEITRTTNGVQRLLPIQQIATNIMAKFGGQVKQGSTFLQNFFKSIGGTTQGTIQARRVLVTYMQHLGEAGSILKSVSGDSNELSKSLKAAQESPGVRWQEFVNQMRALALTIGEGVLPAIGKITPHVREATQWFNNLSVHTKQMIGYFGIGISLGTLLAGVFLLITGAVGGLVAAIAGIGNVGRFMGLITKDAQSASGAVKTLGAEAGSARLGLAAGLGIATFIPALIVFHKQITGIIDSVGGFRNALVLLAAAASGLIFARLIQNISTLQLSTVGLLRTLGLLVAAFVLLKQGIGGADSLWRAWTHSTASVVVGLVLMTSVVYKLMTAIKALTEAEVIQKIVSLGSALVSAATPVAAAASTAVIGGRIATGVSTAAIGAGAVGAEAGLGGLALAGGTLGTVLPVVGVGVAALAGGLYLLHRRADEAKQKAAGLAKQQEELNRVLNAGTIAANSFATAGQHLRDVAQASLDLQQINAQITEARTQLRNAPAGTERTSAQLQLNQLLLQRGDILDRQTKAWKEYYTSANAVGTLFRAQQGVQNEIRNVENRLAKLNLILLLFKSSDPGAFRQGEALARSLGLGVASINSVSAAIDRAKARLDVFKDSSQKTGATFTASVRTMLESLQHAQLVPGTNITEGMVADVSSVMRRLRRMLTQRELRMIIEAEINPNKPPRGLQRWIANFIRRRHFIRVEAVLNTRRALARWRGFTRAIGVLPAGISLPQPPRATPPRVTRGAGGGGGGGVTDRRSVAEWIRLIVQANRIAQKAPSVSNWQKYYALQDQLSKAFTGNQLQAIQEVISAKENQTKTQQRFSDEHILHEARNVQRLERLAKRQNTLAAWKAYYAALAKLQTDASDLQQQAVDQILNTTTTKIDAAAQKAKETVNSILGNLQTMYNDFLQKNKEIFGTLFQGPFSQSAVMQDKMTYGYKMTARDMLRDLKSQIQQFREFNKELALLQRRGAPPELIAQLRELGPSALPQIKALAKSSPSVWKEYLKAFQQSQKLIEAQTRRDLRNQLRIYRQQGKNIALAILSGLQSQDRKLTMWLRRLIAQMFPGLARQARQAQSPAGRRDRRAAARTAAPARRRARSTTRRQRTTTRRAPAPSQRKQYQTSEYNGPATVEYHDHYEITAPRHMEDSVLKQAKHAAWHARTRHRHRDR